jgi:Mitochondrial biogenesis AIM24
VSSLLEVANLHKSFGPVSALALGARGPVGMFERRVGFDIQMVSGFRNILFGGEGLFLATLTGPGRIWLQSRPILNLAEEIGRRLPICGDTGAIPAAGTLGTAAALGAAGSILGGVFGGSDK